MQINRVNIVLSTPKKDARNTMSSVVMVYRNLYQANPTKFQFMLIKKYTHKEIIPDSIEIHGTTIISQTEVKLVRIRMDQELKFYKHVDNLCSKVSKANYI